MIRICWYLIYGHFLSGHKNIGRLRYYCGSTPESVERRAVSAGENPPAHVSLIAHSDQLPRPSVPHTIVGLNHRRQFLIMNRLHYN